MVKKQQQNQPLAACYFAGLIEAGCDEAGRGALAGPVVAAAVVLPPGLVMLGLNDSKKLTEKQRNHFRELIVEHAIDWAVGEVDPETIDRINILNASILAMHKALSNLKSKPQHIIVDGNRFKTWENVHYQCIVGGDALFASIAAASVMAKTHRDEIMNQIHENYPVYGWNKNKAYATELHRKAVETFGLSPHHRKTFCNNIFQLKLNFPDA